MMNKTIQALDETRRRRIAAAAVAMVLCAAPRALAHPGCGIVVHPDGHVIFVLSDGPHNRIMMIPANSDKPVPVPLVVNDRLRAPHHLAMGADGNIYTVSDNDSVVWRISIEGVMTRWYAPRDDGPRVGAGGDPFTVDAQGNVYAIDGPESSRIVKIHRDGTASVLAGGDKGFRDGRGAEARFGGLHFGSMAWGPENVLYLTDQDRVRLIRPDGEVATLEIRTGAKPSFRAMGLAVGGDGTVLVADLLERKVWKIDPNGHCAALPVAPNHTLDQPSGVAVDRAGNVYVLDGSRVWRSSGGVLKPFATAS